MADNGQILNLIRTSSSTEYQERIPNVVKENLAEVQERILNYPTAKNEFINVLTNKVAKTIFFNKIYTNPLKFFKKGTLPYGKSIEQIFVDVIKGKAWNENFGTANTEVSSLIGKESWDNVKVDYITENIRKKYKITISDDQLAGAFRSADGLQTLISMLLSTPITSAEFDEYLMIKKVLSQLTIHERIIEGYNELNKKQKSEELTEVVRATVDHMRFLSDNYNTGGVHTFSKPEDLVILVTPDTKAMLDVQLLGQTFNMSYADVTARVVMIDNFFTYTEEPTDVTTIDDDILAIVCDKNLIQFWETKNASGNFYNPDHLETNMFFHRWAIIGGCAYVNALKIKKPELVIEG